MKNSECLEKLVAMVNDIAKTNLAFMEITKIFIEEYLNIIDIIG